MALKTAYATAAQSQTYLTDKSDWLALTDAQQDTYLLSATYYMDRNYSCSFSTVVEDEAAYACSVLAYADFTTGLYAVDEYAGANITEEEVKAGDVQVKTKYSGAYATSPTGFIDRYPEVTAILNGYCTLKGAQGMSNYRVVRT